VRFRGSVVALEREVGHGWGFLGPPFQPAMASYKFHRWDNALKQCMDAKKKGGADVKNNRWKGDPLLLNQEAHELPPDKQREALDMVDEAPTDLKAKLSPMWKYCFVQWHVWDSCTEAIEKGQPAKDGLQDELFLKDIVSLKALLESGDLEKAKTAEKWTWRLLDPFPAAGSIDPWNDSTATPLLKAGRQERREGVTAYGEEQHEKAFFHFWQGLKELARAPPTVVGPHAKLRCDLYKNKAAAALKLKMPRVALRSANFAVAIDSTDPKAWYRQSCALEMLGRTDAARAALVKAGMAKPLPESERFHPQIPLAVEDSLGTGGDFGSSGLGELPIKYHVRFEEIVFVEVGVDSLAALDMIRHIQSELQDVPVPMTLVFDFPTVEEVATAILQKLNTGDDPYMRARVNSTIWRAMCRALGADPVQGLVEGRSGHVNWPSYTEEEARAALEELRQAYEEEGFTKKIRDLAKRVGFDQRAFLVNLKSIALQVQKPILEARGFDPDADGLRRLECAITWAAAKSPELQALMMTTRIALQGGPNGIWAVNMEPAEVEMWADCHSFTALSKYIKADPINPERKNTNSVQAQAPLY